VHPRRALRLGRDDGRIGPQGVPPAPVRRDRQPVHLMESQGSERLLGNARNAVTRAGTMRFRLDMQTTMTNVRGGTWDSEAILTGEYTRRIGSWAY